MFRWVLVASFLNTHPLISSMLNKSEFTKIRKEMVQFEENRESLIQSSRKIIQLSKKIIYAIHRSDLKTAKSGSNEIKKLVKKFPHQRFDTNMWSVALQEYVEAMTYYYFITENRIPGQKELEVPFNEYLLGLCDLSGELVRKAVKSSIENNLSEVQKIHDLVAEIYAQFLEFNLRNSELRRKSDQIKYALAKLEDILYRHKMRE